MGVLTRLRSKLARAAGRLPGLRGIARRRKLRARFPTEVALLEGRHRTDSDHPSILHFSVNRAATQYVKRILGACAAEHGLTPVRIHDYAFKTSLPYLDLLSREEFREYEHIFRPRGYLYGPFGGLIRWIPDRDEYLTVLMVRDPRDVLVSRFYAEAYSHSAPGEAKLDEFRDIREEALRLGPDDYVLEKAEALRDIYGEYAEHLVGRPNVHVTRYERMVADFPGWLDDLTAFCRLPMSAELRAGLIAANAPPPEEEDVQKHRRQVTPGDHRRKLEPATVERLEDILAGVLEAFDYGSRRAVAGGGGGGR